MKNIFYIISLTFLCSCSNEEEEPILIPNKIEITEITPRKLRIGDTLTIRGENLDKISGFQFKGYGFWQTLDPFEKKSEEVKIIVPFINHETFNLLIFDGSSIINSTPLNLIGTFLLKYKFQDYDVTSVKIVNEKTFFVAADSKLYKSLDGGYTWQIIKDFGVYIGSSMFFLNENHGWVEVYDDYKSIVYYTSDGGATFEKVFENFFVYKSIIQIYFSSPTNGYLLTTKGEIYQTNDNSNFNLIYDFPYSNQTSGWTEFNNLSVFNNTLIASGESGTNGITPTLIIKKDNVFNYSNLDKVINNVQLINESQAYLVKNEFESIEDKLFFTNDIDSNWEETSNQRIHNFYFINKNTGIGVSSSANYNNHIIFETYDGGKSWINKFEFKNFEYCLDIDFHNNIGLITGKRGKIWKHIFE